MHRGVNYYIYDYIRQKNPLHGSMALEYGIHIPRRNEIPYLIVRMVIAHMRNVERLFND